MKLATTTGDFAIYASHQERIAHLHQAGFRYIDLSLYEETDMEPFMQADWMDKAKKLKAYAEKLGMQLVQAHSPGFNPLQRDENWERFVSMTVRSVEVCGVLGIPCTVVHAGWAPGIDIEAYFTRNLAFYRLLFPVMEQYEVSVLIENSAKSNMGACYYFLDGADMKAFLQAADHPLLHACWDTGHANIEGHQYADIIALGADLYALHINDNHGSSDEHILPFTGTLCLDEVMCALRDIDYRGYFTFEASATLVKQDGWPYCRMGYRNTALLADPPAFLYDQLEASLYAIGKHILTAYDCLEEA